MIRRVRLSEFRKSAWKHYGYAVLDRAQIEWIMMAKSEGKKNENIARVLGLSERRIRQLFSLYRRGGGAIPALKEPSRPKALGITEHERILIRHSHQRFRMRACYLEMILSAHGIKISHNRIHSVLREEGLAINEPLKQRRRRWIRYVGSTRTHYGMPTGIKSTMKGGRVSGSSAVKMTTLAS